MPVGKIIIKRKSDSKPAFDIPQTAKLEVVDNLEMAIVEGGMKSGKASVGLHTVLPDGTHVVIETSAEIFKGLAAALAGAEERFKTPE